MIHLNRAFKPIHWNQEHHMSDIFYRRYDQAGRQIFREEEDELVRDGPTTTGDAAAAAADNIWWTAAAWRASAGPKFEEDPDFDPYDEATLASLIEQHKVPRMYADRLLTAVNRDHASAIAGRIQDELENQRIIDDWGNPVGRFVLQMAVGMVDPLAVISTVGTGGAAAAARIGVSASRASRAFRAGLTAGGVDATGETFRVSQSPTSGADDVAYAYLGSFTFGLVSGGIGRGLSPRERELLTGSIERARQSLAERVLEQQRQGGSSAGAAQNITDTDPLSAQDVLRSFDEDQGEVSRSSGNLATRFDAAGRLGRNRSRIVRRVSQWLLSDGAGREGGATNLISAEEVKGALTRRYETSLFRDFDSAYRQWRRLTGASRGRDSLRQFNRLVTRATRDPGQLDSLPGSEAISRASQAQQRFYREMLGEAQSAGLMENISARGDYVNRMWLPDRIRELTREVGEANVVKLLAQAIRIEDVDGRAIADTLPEARVLYRTLKSADLDQTFRASKGDKAAMREVLETVMREETGKSLDELSEQIDSLLDLIAPDGEKAAGKGTRSMRRIRFNETFGMHLGGRVVYLDELLENDAINLASIYANQVAGRAGIARSSGGRIKSDTDFKRYMDQIGKTAEAEGISVDEANRMAGYLTKYYENLTGQGRLHDPFLGEDGAKALQAMRDWNFSRFMGQVGFSQASEAGTLIAAYGLRNFLSQATPALKTLIADYRGKGSQLGDEVTDVINNFWGFGDGYVRSRMASMQNRLDDAGLEPADIGRGRPIENVADFSQDAARAVSIIGGLQPITDTLHSMAIRMGLANFASRAARGKPLVANARRRASMGMTEKDASDISEALLETVDTRRNAAGGWDITGFDPSRASNPEAIDKLFMVLYRETRRTIQENDQGNLNLLLTGPVAKTILQFQSFSMVSFTKQLHNGFAVRDAQVVLEFLMSLSFAATSFAAQTHIKSIGREDREEYVEEQLGQWGSTEGFLKLAAAGFRRSAQASVVPQMMDMAIMGTGFEPVFDQRASGLASGMDISASPTGDLANSVLQLPKQARALLDEDYEYSEATLRDVTRLLPGQNTMPAVLAQTLILDRVFELPEQSE